MTTHIYVQTRGKQADYKFLGKSPPHKWWHTFRDATSFELPTLIFKGNTEKWKCYLSGIQSSRKDRVGTSIRYTLVMENDCGSLENFNIISAWIEDAASFQLNQKGPKKLGEELDKLFPETLVERMIASQNDEDVSLTLPVLQDQTNFESKREPGSWYASMSSKPARAALMGRIEDLMQGKEKGFAAWLNLLGKDEVVAFAQEINDECAILITDSLEEAFTPITINTKSQPDISNSEKRPRPEDKLNGVTKNKEKQYFTHNKQSKSIKTGVLMAILAGCGVGAVVIWLLTNR